MGSIKVLTTISPPPIDICRKVEMRLAVVDGSEAQLIVVGFDAAWNINELPYRVGGVVVDPRDGCVSAATQRQSGVRKEQSAAATHSSLSMMATEA